MFIADAKCSLTRNKGRVDPVPFYVKNDLTGLGKANQDVRMSKLL